MSGSEIISDPDIISRGPRYYLGVRDIISGCEILSRTPRYYLDIISRSAR